MSLKLKIHTSSERRPSFKGKSRILLQSSPPPESPLLKGNNCEALEVDGRQCQHELASEGETWCKRHTRELKELKTRWTTYLRDAERIEALSPSAAKQRVLKFRQAVDHRRHIRERFYPRGGDTADFIKWITKLERDVRALADSILMSNLDRGPTPETPGATTPLPDKANSEKIMILQSPLDPRIPIDSLQGMPDDGTILILKHFYRDLCAEGVRRLYSIIPDLNDSARRPGSPVKDAVQDSGTDIIRAWFRIMILNDSEAEALEHATRSKSIDEFLSGCHASQLETYCDFFEKAWRPHALQYLRVAICAQTLAGGDIKTIGLLGGMIPSTTESLKMTKPCWDILYRWFPSLLTPWTVASICSNFEDYTTICKLLMLGLYREYWYDPGSILAECPTGIYLGFLPSSKGGVMTTTAFKHMQDHIVQEESRNYICGQMAIADPLTQEFLDELRRRSERLLLVVYEGTNADATVHPSDADIFIKRHRAAKSHEELDSAEWTTTVTLEDIKNDLRLRKTSMYDPIVVDSW
ncbi:unnamed protein product [Periconia digitata]|uniref:Uncharacterized protein n=1 Tax=Periconia digitata TaxID=1303443 RepID=A0A9W4U9A4_9PLEO|nr:unnamed protein product [Periconia digitata]